MNKVDDVERENKSRPITNTIQTTFTTMSFTHTTQPSQQEIHLRSLFTSRSNNLIQQLPVAENQLQHRLRIKKIIRSQWIIQKPSIYKKNNNRYLAYSVIYAHFPAALAFVRQEKYDDQKVLHVVKCRKQEGYSNLCLVHCEYDWK